MRRTKQEEAGTVILRKQREVIRDVMLSAGQCATWLTLDELAKLTHYPQASISAQLRHLRKPRNGAHTVVKRCRTTNKAMRAEGFAALWEYSVMQERRVPTRRTVRPARSAGVEARHIRVELERHRQISVAAGYSSTAQRVGRRLRAGRAEGARGTGLGFAHGAFPALLPRPRALRECAALSRPERAQLVNWTEEVRNRCGKELLRRGMSPPRKYFREAT
jgi:hypothetical protein